MKNKKLLKALAALTLSSAAAAGCISLIGCSHKHEYSDTYSYDETYHWYGATCEHTDEIDGKAEHTFGADDKCTYCGYEKPAPHVHTYSTEWTKTETEHWYAATCEHKDEKKDRAAHNFDDDGVCSVCQYEKNEQGDGGDEEETEYTVAFDNGDKGTKPADQKVKKDGKVTDPGTLTETGWIFKGWYKDADHTTEFDFDTETITDNTTIYAWWVEDTEEPEPEGYDEVTTPFPYASAVERYPAGKTNVIPDGTVFGRFTINGAKKAYMNSETEINTQGCDILVDLNGEVNSISFSIVGKSGNGCVLSLVKVVDESETIVKSWDSLSSGSKLDVNETLDAGSYIIRTKNSGAISLLQITEKLKKSNPVKIEVSGASSEFLIGENFNANGLKVELVYKNGRRDILTTDQYLLIRPDNMDMDVSGKYTISVQSKEHGFIDTYDVFVYKVDSLVLGKNKIVTGHNGYNGTYENHALKQLYLVGEQLDLDGLTLQLHGSVNGEADKTKIFYRNGEETTLYTTSGFDSASTGVKTVTVTAYNESASFEVNVVADPKTELANAASVSLNVDPAAQEMGKVGASFVFKTIQQALDFLEAVDTSLAPNATKTINLAAGTYTEKLEINIANLTIQGVSREQVKIEWGSLYGQKDESDFTHVTDSTATLAVRKNATGFTIEGVTISNKYNSQESYNEILGIGSSGERALAAIIQADQVTIAKCSLLGYQDTLELFTGRQFIYNTLISGTTDFIFGSNNTTYFYNCEIRSIATADNTKGGYITAFKGNNGEVKNDVKYGAIFDNCKFTAEEGVENGKTAIGRAWGSTAAVMVMNSDLGEHISKGTGTSRNNRYVDMNFNVATTETLQFYEYNNRGLGAINANQTGVKVLDKTAADDYADLTKVFGTTNKNVTWAEAWTVTLPDIVAEVRAASLAELAAYRNSDIDKIDSSAYSEVLSAIGRYKAETFESYDTAAKVTDRLSELKELIDIEIDKTRDIADVRAEALAELDTLIANLTDGKYTEEVDAELFSSIKTERDKVETATSAETVASALEAAKAEISKIVSEYAESVKHRGEIFYEDFETGYTAGQVMPTFSGVYGNAGIYSVNTGDAIINEAGNAVQTAKAAGGNRYFIIDFGPATGTVKGSFTVAPTAMGSKWSIVQFVNSNGGDVFTLYTKDSDGTMQYYLTGGSATPLDSTTAVAIKTNKFTVNFEFDLTTGKTTISIDMGGKNYVVVSELATSINDVAGVKFGSSSSGSRLVIVDDISVKGTKLALEDYKAKVLEKLKAEYDKYDENLYTQNYADITVAFNAAKDEINAVIEENYALVIEKYLGGIEAMKAFKTDAELQAEAELQQVKSSALTELEGYRNNEFTTPSEEGKEGNLEKYEAALKAGKKAINEATTPEEVATALKNAKDAIDNNYTDLELTATKFTVTFANSDIVIDPVVENTTVDRPKDPVAEGYTFVDWYKDEGFTSLFDFSEPITQETTIYAKWTGSYSIKGNTTSLTKDDFTETKAATVAAGATKEVKGITLNEGMKIQVSNNKVTGLNSGGKSQAKGGSFRTITFALSSPAKVKLTEWAGKTAGSALACLYSYTGTVNHAYDANEKALLTLDCKDSDTNSAESDLLPAGNYIIKFSASYNLASIEITEYASKDYEAVEGNATKLTYTAEEAAAGLDLSGITLKTAEGDIALTGATSSGLNGNITIVGEEGKSFIKGDAGVYTVTIGKYNLAKTYTVTVA